MGNKYWKTFFRKYFSQNKHGKICKIFYTKQTNPGKKYNLALPLCVYCLIQRESIQLRIEKEKKKDNGARFEKNKVRFVKDIFIIFF